MDNKIILTIGRQFGSGGREIGQRLAKELGIGYYDKELITVAARESGLCEDVFEKADERASSGLSYAFTMGYSSFMGGMFTPYNDILSNDGLFKIQSDAIRKLAETESCVLVGRCADYILRDNPACLSFFIHSSVESRVQKTVAYYNYYTNKTWGMASSYNFSIDVSVLGIDETVEFMKSFIERRLNKRPPHFG